MPTFYQSIEAVQAPFPFGVDSNDRTMFACNYLGISEAPNTTWERDIAALISATTALGSLGSTMFIGPATPIPTGTGPYISIIPTAGFSPSRTHNSNNSKQQSLGVQVVVRGKDYTATQTLAHAIWARLDGRYNTTV